MNTENSFENVVGDSFEDMSVYDMALVQGSGDVNVETHPTVIVASRASSAQCGKYASAVASAVGSAAVSVAKC